MSSVAKVIVPVADEGMNMEWFLNDSDGRRYKYLEENLTHGYYDHHKPHADWLGIRPGSPR
jgi:hypothetical protein